MKEIWKAIPGYPNYEASDQGRIRSLGKGKNPMNGRLLSARPHSGGYLQVALSRNGKLRTRYIHRLVLEAFVGTSTKVTNHKNGIKTDNRLENLEYCTQKENIFHAYAQGLSPKGEAHYRAKLSNKEIAQIRNEGGFQKDIAQKYGISRSYVSQIKSGARRT